MKKQNVVFFTDTILSTYIILCQSLPHNWFHRKCYVARKLSLAKWLLLGNMLALAYRSTLNSTLVTMQYEDPIDTIKDMVQSDLPLLVPQNLKSSMANDPRQVVKDINSNSIVFQYYPNGTGITRGDLLEKFQNGEAGMPVTAYDMKMNRMEGVYNMSLHYTKDTLFNSLHTTFIVPKGSPLQVGNVHLNL